MTSVSALARRWTRVPSTNRSDVLIALVLFAVGLTLISAGVRSFSEIPAAITVPSQTWHVVPLALGCLGVTMQSRRPELSFAIATAAFWADTVIGLHMAVLTVWVNVVYAVGRHASNYMRVAMRWLVGVTALAMALWVLFFGGGPEDAILAMLQVGVLSALALWLSGDARDGDDRARSERVRSEKLLRAQAEEMRRDRAQLAVQLHETVSSNLSSIALFTTGALDSGSDPARDRVVLKEARLAALEGLKDMRSLIDLLRREDDCIVHGPDDDFATIDQIVAGLEPVGLKVDAELTSVQLAPPQERALAQVAKESLTNALKHGDGHASVRLVTRDSMVELTVINGIPERDLLRQELAVISGGIGLGAMAARICEVGGRFTSGESGTPRARVWSVRAEVPQEIAPTGMTDR